MIFPESNPSPQTRLPRILKWAMIGCMFLFVLIFLPLACLVVPEYLRAGQAPQTTPITLMLLAPDRTKVNVSSTVQKANPLTNATNIDTTTAKEFKPFIDAHSKWGRKLGSNCEKLNAHYAPILERIAKYEATREKMDLNSAWREFEAIDQAFQNVSFELCKLLGLKKGFFDDHSTLAQRFDEYWQWSLTARARLDERDAQYVRAAKWLKALQAQKMGTWLRSRHANSHESLATPWPEFYQDQENQALWTQEMHLWRQAGGFVGFKGIARAVINRKAREIGAMFLNTGLKKND